MTAARPPRRVRASFFWAPFAVFALLGMLWSLASPVFSVPDENAHALKAIAQVRGQVIGYTLPDVKHIVVDLPPGYEYHPNILCFATYPERTADCGVELGDAGGQDWFNTWVGAYNPVYYYLVGWPSLLFEGSAGIYAMRIASSLLGAALLAWAFFAAASGRRSRWMPLGIAFAAAPMSMYLIGAVNPNGAEIAAAVAVWAGVLRLLETFGDEEDRPWLSRAALWVGVTAASVMLVNARALGPLWLVVVVGLCLVASGWTAVKRLFTTGSSYWWLAAIGVGGLFSLGWTSVGWEPVQPGGGVGCPARQRHVPAGPRIHDPDPARPPPAGDRVLRVVRCTAARVDLLVLRRGVRPGPLCSRSLQRAVAACWSSDSWSPRRWSSRHSCRPPACSRPASSGRAGTASSCTWASPWSPRGC